MPLRTDTILPRSLRDSTKASKRLRIEQRILANASEHQLLPVVMHQIRRLLDNHADTDLDKTFARARVRFPTITNAILETALANYENLSAEVRETMTPAAMKGVLGAIPLTPDVLANVARFKPMTVTAEANSKPMVVGKKQPIATITWTGRSPIQWTTEPLVTSFLPQQPYYPHGTVITMHGLNLQPGAVEIELAWGGGEFKGRATVPATSASAKSVVFEVPTNANPNSTLKFTGGWTLVTISVTPPGGTVKTAGTFTIDIGAPPKPPKLSEQPQITSLDPTSLRAGESLLINGQNFSSASCSFKVWPNFLASGLGNTVNARGHDSPQATLGSILQAPPGTMPLANIPNPPASVVSSTQLTVDLPPSIPPGRYDLNVTRLDGADFVPENTDWLSFTVQPSKFALQFDQIRCVLKTSDSGEDEIIVVAYGAGDNAGFTYRTPSGSDFIFSHFESGDVFDFPAGWGTVFPSSGAAAPISQGLAVSVIVLENDGPDQDAVKDAIGFATSTGESIANALGHGEIATAIGLVGTLLSDFVSLFSAGGIASLGQVNLGWDVQDLLYATTLPGSGLDSGEMQFYSPDPDDGFDYRISWKLIQSNT